ncbi:hypothetical protein GCM10027098_05260 [Bowmanella dokdonensis]
MQLKSNPLEQLSPTAAPLYTQPAVLPGMADIQSDQWVLNLPDQLMQKLKASRPN